MSLTVHRYYDVPGYYSDVIHYMVNARLFLVMGVRNFNFGLEYNLKGKLPRMSADSKVRWTRKKKCGRHGPTLVCYKEAQRQNNYIACVSF